VTLGRYIGLCAPGTNVAMHLPQIAQRLTTGGTAGDKMQRYALFNITVMLCIHGCGAAANLQTRAPGHLELATALPAPTASPFGQAYGGTQARDMVAVGAPELEGYLTPQAAPLHPKRVRQAAVVVAPAPVLVAEATPAPPAAASSPLAVTEPTTDAHRYAQRQDKKLEQYRGGDVIVIGASTLLIILLIVVLVLLLR
jgi:hypothetical protein